MTPAPILITAYPAAHQRREPAGGPVAASAWSLPMQPCAHLIGLAEICNEIAAPLLDAATHRAACLAHCPPGGRTYRDTAAIFDQGAVHARGLKQVEQLLRELAQDADFHRFAEAKASGRVLVAEQADRAGPVVVAGEDHRPAPQQMRPQHPAKALLGRLWPRRKVAA